MLQGGISFQDKRTPAYAIPYHRHFIL